MSYVSWHNYGYGICVSDIKEESVARLQTLLKMAPVLDKNIHEWISESSITDPDWDDYTDYDQDTYLGLAALLQMVIQEAEGLDLTACDSSDGETYLLFQPCYPWNLTDSTREITEEQLKEIFKKYVDVLTDEALDVDYYSVENGG